MKKLLFFALIGIFCFVATNTAAQKQKEKETLHETTINAEVENKVLKAEIERLNLKIKSLDSQMTTLQRKVNVLEQKIINGQFRNGQLW